MRDTIKLELDRYEIGIILNALREFRNAKIKEEISTDAVDDLYIKIADIYQKKCPLLPAIRKDYAR